MLRKIRILPAREGTTPLLVKPPRKLPGHIASTGMQNAPNFDCAIWKQDISFWIAFDQVALKL